MANKSDYVEARQEGEYFLPPGLRQSLYLYARRAWVRFGKPIPLFEHLHKTFGPIAQYRFFGNLIVFVNEPEWIQQILVDQAPSFIKERTLKRMKILLGEGLITSDDPIHMRQRRIAAPAFHRQRIVGYADEIVANARETREGWQPGAEIDANAEMMRLSLKIIARTLFDTEVTPEVLSVADEVNSIMEIYNLLVALPKLESYLHWPLPYLSRFRRSRQRLNRIVESMIASRRSLSREELEQRHDLLSMLVASRDEGDGTGMSDEQLRDETLTIFLAGYETVANALTWTLYLLSENPEARTRMEAEIDGALGDRNATLSDYERLPYTEQVFAESMRLYPPAWAMGRRSTKPVQLGPYRIPAGAHFFFSQYVMHRSEEFWEAPLEFRPERHTAEAKASRPRFVYFPFGGGRRQCIGENFAWMEGVLSLATLLQRRRLEFVPRFPVEAQAKITLRPRFPMMMRVEERG
ncbi:MAG: cytochrome P450 [Acidobacteriaceae bacterium]|nr:cytochrome P450 [Acidobacteriaceae bacterium]